MQTVYLHHSAENTFFLYKRPHHDRASGVLVVEGDTTHGRPRHAGHNVLVVHHPEAVAHEAVIQLREGPSRKKKKKGNESEVKARV